MKNQFHFVKLIGFFLFAVIVFASCSQKEQVLKGHIDSLSDQQTLTFKAKEGQKLNAVLIPDPQGNIRINQIISPSGNADGPFGQTLEYDITETGEWKFVVGGSLMQGDEYKGIFQIKVDLK